MTDYDNYLTVPEKSAIMLCRNLEEKVCMYEKGVINCFYSTVIVGDIAP